MAESLKLNLDILIFNRDDFFRNIEYLYNKATTLSIEASAGDLSEFKVRCEHLGTHYDNFKKYQLDIAKCLISMEDTDKLADLKNQSKFVDEMYFHILSAKEIFLNPSAQMDSSEIKTKSNQSSVKLPKINLPLFDGVLKDWPAFKDTFTALVHNNDSISKIEKFHYLLSSTKGEPNSLLKSLPLCASNYELVWTHLNDRYDNKRLLAAQYIDEILHLSSINVESPKPLRHLLDTLSENTAALKQMNIPESLGEFIILHIALKNVDKHTRQLFERKFSDTEYPTLTNFFDFLRDHCKALEAAGDNRSKLNVKLPFKPPQTKSPQFHSSLNNQKSFHVNTPVASTPVMSCLYCNDNHAIYHCSAYLKLLPSQRRDIIKSKEACFNCLSKTHMLSQCKSSGTCFKCHRKHHTSLHEDQFIGKPARPSTTIPVPQSKGTTPLPQSGSTPPVPKSNATLQTSTSINSTSALTCTTDNSQSNHHGPTTTLLATALIRIQDSTGSDQLVRSLIDPGSQSSFITEACVQRLSLSRRKNFQPIQGLSETSVSGDKGVVFCSIKPRLRDDPILTTKAIILNCITSSLPSVSLHQEVKEYFKNWDLADPEFHSPGKVEFLIGADVFPQLFDGGRQHTPPGMPTAYQSIFGWLLIGETSIPYTSKHTVSANLAISDHHTLESSLKQFWEIEEPPTAKCTSPDDDRCESIYSSTVQRTPSGRFVVTLPFKSDSPDLGDSYEKAKGCLLSLERKFQQNPEFQTAYRTFMNDYKDLSHMTKSETSEKQSYYIPHHGIFKTNTTNPKLRVVFNASAPTTSGRSLNDELLVGPKLQTNICKILSLFRLHSYVFTSDIEKMYRQLLINPDHRKYQAILWRNNPEEPISTYLLNTVTYGVTTSPFLALRSLQQLASEHSNQYPAASEVVLNSMFVDDILTGSDSLKSALKLKSELIDLLNLGGFSLRKWSSNSPELLEDVPAHHQELVFQEDKMENASIKILGLKWSPTSDVFSYDVNVTEIPSTKRTILSQISKVFDPLGLITPVVLWAKCLIQQIWMLGLTWDEPLPHDLASQSANYFEELPLLSKLSISRQVLPSKCSNIQLHGFSDASETGYGCVIYLRTVNESGTISTSLLLAKSKVAPLKRLSVPRLELCGTLLLSKTLKFCQEILLMKLGNIPTYAWTDSLVTLHWIRSAPHLLKTFVANRIAELQSLIEPSLWRHTPTTSNPADLASRGLMPHQILDNSLWWYGPDWLKEDDQYWPSQTLSVLLSNDSLTEYRTTKTFVSTSMQDENCFTTNFIERFSDFRKLQACLGWILRFIKNCQKTRKKVSSPFLTAEERNSSLLTMIKLTQSQHFTEHITSISASKPCPPFLQRLDPFIDDSGILRVGGRIKHAQVTFDAKHPVLLPKVSHLTSLLVDHFHLKYLHIGPRGLQSILSRQFWIISARQVIRHRLSKCLMCTKIKGQSLQPYMGNLPDVRLRQSRPFLHVGVDYGGPFTTKTGVSRKPQLLKSYICLFICLSTKAVHLELVSSLSTEAFLAALDRFVSRRGFCTQIYSDQGTNFIGANRELKELHNMLRNPDTSKIIQSKLASQGIQWHFNPPAAPHFGGLWESGIKSTKHHLTRCLGNQILTFEEFATLLTKIEAVLNSRPLCSISPDPNEVDVLTPGHFLIGEPLTSLPQDDFTSTPVNRLSRWQLVQQAQRSFWKTWSNEYLLQLQQRTKWNRHQPNLKIGDVVLVKDKNLPPLRWISARVLDLHPGEDGVVRVVTLKTSTGVLKRPAVQLCLLPKDED